MIYLVPPKIMSFDPITQQQCLLLGHGPWPEMLSLHHTLVSNKGHRLPISLEGPCKELNAHSLVSFALWNYVH